MENSPVITVGPLLRNTLAACSIIGRAPTVKGLFQPDTAQNLSKKLLFPRAPFSSFPFCHLAWPSSLSEQRSACTPGSLGPSNPGEHIQKPLPSPLSNPPCRQLLSTGQFTTPTSLSSIAFPSRWANDVPFHQKSSSPSSPTGLGGSPLTPNRFPLQM